MAAPAERVFAVFERGQMRDEILAYFRTGLRTMLNPDTGEPFSETEIATATAQGSSFWHEADALDLVLLAQQSRALYLADQVIVTTASSEWLNNYHGPQWEEVKLGATGASGPVNATATPGSTFIGSTTVPDPAATVATDPAGLRYQVLTTVITPVGGTAALTIIAIDTGVATNITAGTTLTWSANAPLGALPTATVTGLGFTGGTDAETDQDFADRIASRIRNKPASGNWAHLRAWARESSNAVEDAFVYSCPFHAGSVMICVVQKRSDVTGPLARKASAGTLSTVTAYLVPPGSSVVPMRAHVVVTTFNEEPADAEIQISMPAGSGAGWADAIPWPGYTDGAGTVSTITNVTSSTVFRIHSDTAIPLGVTQPQVMLWDESRSRWEKLLVASVLFFGGNQYQLTLSQAPTATVALGEYVSPYTSRAQLIAETIEQYFDALGPGELFDLATDTRGHRAMRRPAPAEEYPFRVGAALASRISEALGQNAADVVVADIAPKVPTYPTNIIDGPSQLVCGKMAIYAF